MLSLNTSKNAAAAMLALTLVALPLAGCGGQASQGGDASSGGAEQTQAAMDVTSWTTLGDAMAYSAEGGKSTASWDEKHYVTMFDTTGGGVVRVVAKMDPETYDAFGELSILDDDYNEKFLEVMGGLELESAEDLTDGVMTQDQLDAYKGKTGQDLVDAGFVFESYSMYGGDETDATMSQGYYAYNVTFDVGITDSQSEDEGASIMGATIKAMEFAGASNEAVELSTIS